MDVYTERGAFGPSFGEKAIRKAFVIKVFFLLSIQFAITIGIMCICLFVKQIREVIIENFLIFVITFGLAAVILELILSCIRSVRSAVPLNFILLTVMTCFFSMFLASLSARYTIWTILSAGGITAGSVLILTIVASLPCFDVTGWGLYIFMASMVFSLVGMGLIIVGLIMQMRIMFMIYAGIASLLICMYIIFDIQMILGGRKHQLSSDEYILGVVLLYTDIITLYTMVLVLFGGSN